ncbi:MAG: DUF1972 domain-containing protein [Mariniphaga sp.]|nr:DUF1972 domain-containing protein [Mariniphaga sp.]
MRTRIAIIGSHGLYANYGGWDQLVNNLAEKKSKNIEYLIFNSLESKISGQIPPGVKVKYLNIRASGFQGLFYDFWSICLCFWKVDVLLLLGTQGIPLVFFLLPFIKIRLVSNIGGIEWERPKFNYLAKLYLKFCFKVSTKISHSLILDNFYYRKILPEKVTASVHIIPYGGTIDSSLIITDAICEKYPFFNKKYYLSVSRALEDNLILELCESFAGTLNHLVIISNFSTSVYGTKVYEKYNELSNITLINGLYNKPELDLIRRNCTAYIHTHTLCGTAPSLVEMVVCRKPIISIDIPQNRYTLNNQGFYFNDFSVIQSFIEVNPILDQYIPAEEIAESYNWGKIIKSYETLFF